MKIKTSIKLTILSLIILSTNTSFSQETKTKEIIFNEFNNLKKSEISDKDYLNKLREKSFKFINLEDSKLNKNYSQYFLIVDSSNEKQNLFLAFWDKEINDFSISNHYQKISSGKNNLKQHFITPTGWLEQNKENGSYRALGTKNSNGIRGNGIKNMRVWDFGWQQAYTGWLKNPELRDIRMQMHATDPDFLEQKLGTPASKGCIRVSTELNKFIDENRILDKNLSEINHFSLSKAKNYVIEQGSLLLVINTDEK